MKMTIGGGSAQNLVFDEGVACVKDWVGYGDARDWFSIEINDAADKYYFDLWNTVNDKYVKMKLYNVDEFGKLGKGIKLGSDSGVDLADGNYALEISSADNGKGKKNTSYELFISPYGGGIS